MNALEFIAAGVEFERPTIANGWRWIVKGPDDGAELLDELRFEVSTRIPLVGAEERIPRGEFAGQLYRCDLCGDQIGHARRGECALCPTHRCRGQSGGMCILCCIARERAMREVKRDGTGR